MQSITPMKKSKRTRNPSCKTLEECLDEVNNLKSKVQELMLETDESIEHEEWSNKKELEVQENDALTEELQNWTKELRKRENK